MPQQKAQELNATKVVSPQQATGGQKTQTPDRTAPQKTSTPTSESSRKSSRVSPSTTARNKKKKSQNSRRCQKGARVKVCRKDFYHVLSDDDQRNSLKGFGNNRNFHGTIISGSGKQGYNIRFDDLPAGR